MRKMLIAFFALSVLLIGCEKEEKKEPPKVTTQEPKEVEQKEYSGLILKTEPVLEGDKIHLSVSLENTSDEPIPFYMKENALFKVIIQNDKGNVIKEEIYKEESRVKIQPKEKVNWDKEISLSEQSETFKITTELLFIDKEKETYKKEEFKSSKEVKGNKVQLTYLPNEKRTYVYDELFKNGEIKEEFLFFKDSYVQSKSTLEGTKVYFEDKEGLHVVYMNDFNVIDKNIIGDIDPDKKTILQFPVEEGKKWTVDDVTYEIVSTDEYLETPYKDFENVVVVDISNGTTLYYHESVGLIQIDVQGNTMITLKNIE